jgi:hypothetical protein
LGVYLSRFYFARRRNASRNDVTPRTSHDDVTAGTFARRRDASREDMMLNSRAGSTGHAIPVG